MGMARAASLLVAAGLWSAAAGLSAQAWEAGTDGLLPIPDLRARVTDLTQTLSAAEAAALEAKLADWETRTSNQLAVLIVPTTQPEPIEGYALRVAEKWKIGRKGQDNGALFLIAKNDRKMRIEVGYGLEGVLPDVTANRIIRENVAPSFREGKFAAGINAGVDRIIAVVGEGKSSASPVDEIAAKVRRGGGLDIEKFLLILFFVVPIAGGVLRRLFGRFGGSVVGGGSIGVFVWLLAGSILFGVIGGIVAFIVMAAMGMGGGTAYRGGGWTSTGGGWGGGGGSWGGGSSGSSGGFSGGGGSFGGGGSSGSW